MEQIQQTPSLRLNQLAAPPGKNRKRVGRGIGSGLGKTAGRGHKGQRARSGGRRDAGFEGGQMPLHRRVPKRGFRSRLARVTGRVRLADLDLPADVLADGKVTVAALKEAGVLRHDARRARVFCAGEISRAVTLHGIVATAGARAAIEKAGGKVEAAKKAKVAVRGTGKRAAAKSAAAAAAGVGKTAGAAGGEK